MASDPAPKLHPPMVASAPEELWLDLVRVLEDEEEVRLVGLLKEVLQERRALREGRVLDH